jgi:hypothetical protein
MQRGQDYSDEKARRLVSAFSDVSNPRDSKSTVLSENLRAGNEPQLPLK